MKILYICLFLLTTPWVSAQSLGPGILEGTVTFGDWVVWGQANLSSGTYTLTVEYAHPPVRVKLISEHGKTDVLFPLTILAGAESGRTRVCLVRDRDRVRVRSLDLPELGISLLFMPRNLHTIDEQTSCLPIAMGSSHAK